MYFLQSSVQTLIRRKMLLGVGGRHKATYCPSSLGTLEGPRCAGRRATSPHQGRHEDDPYRSYVISGVSRILGSGGRTRHFLRCRFAGR